MNKLWGFSLATPVCAGIMCMILSLPVNAALISIDWQTAGDGLLVRDTTTQLEWLKLTESIGMTYSGDIDCQFGPGGSFEGLRYATNAEVINLYTVYFGIALGTINYGEYPGFIDPGVRLASEILGDGVSGGTDEYSGPNANYRLMGYTGELMINGARFVLGARTRWSDTDYFTARDPLPYGEIYGGNFGPTIGSYLVRTSAVPLPAATWLFGSGLLGLIGLAKRRPHITLTSKQSS